jgi:predicted alternative tryptophan synthase beta-subunit
MNEQVIRIFMVVIIIAIAIYTFYTKLKDLTNNQLAKVLENETYKLFLYAESMDWIGAEKMNWCIKQLYVNFPDIIKTIVKESTIELWAQDLYNDFKVWAKEQTSA